MVNGWLSFEQRTLKKCVGISPGKASAALRVSQNSGAMAGRRRVNHDARPATKSLVGRERRRSGTFLIQALRSVERREPARKIGLEVLDILQADVEPQCRAARRPWGGGTVGRAVERNDKALEAAP